MCVAKRMSAQTRDADKPVVIPQLFTEFNCDISLCYSTCEWIKKIIHTNKSNVMLFSNKKVEFCSL